MTAYTLPKAVDLCCGRGAVTRALLRAGFDVTGVDIVHHPDYPKEAHFILSDIRCVDGRMLPRRPVFIWASPPCTEFSRWRMPWTRSRAVEPSLELVQACYRIRDEAQPDFFILENVREAQRWLGPAILQRAERYLWGDIVLAPFIRAKAKESYSGSRPDLRSEVPEELVYAIGCMVMAGTQYLRKHLERLP